MHKKILFLVVMAAALVLAACGSQATEAPPTTAPETAAPAEVTMPTEAPAEAMGEGDMAAVPSAEEVAPLFQKGGCVACHVIPGVPGAVGTIGPDLSDVGAVAAEILAGGDYTGTATTVEEYLEESIVAPDAFLAPDCNGVPCQAGQMPAGLDALYTAEEMNMMVAYMASLTEGGAAAPAEGGDMTVVTGEAPELTEEEFAEATQIFFDRCAGCHGVLRKGATGPALTPDVTLPKGTLALETIIFNGTPRGMPDWGRQGVLTEAQANLMARFIQNEPPQPPEMSLEQMKETWTVFIAPEDRPSEPQTDRNWQNYFVVTLRDAGQVAVIDGDTYEVVNTVDTGYAVHITRMSATGRYAYVIGRDGKVALIDLWMETPDKVAEVQACYDARSVDTSKYEGFEDKYAIVGCYWPPHFAIVDGATLEPMKIVSTRSYTYDTEEYHPEPRVASIVASHFSPEWIVNVKETGQVWLVDYSDPHNPTIKMLESERFLHDGGWDASKRYFLVAANARDKVVVVDAQEQKIEAIVETGVKPHPGRGANFVDPEYGPVWCTGHIGQGLISCIGTDPENYPDSAWKVVREIELPSAGSLFIKTHPNSQWIWVDLTLSTDEQLQRSVCVIDKNNPTEVAKCWEIADYGRAVHFEYNQAGDQVWVSVWGTADQPGKTGEIVVYDDATLEEIARIPDLVTPTGKFNVYNTVGDIY